MKRQLLFCLSLILGVASSHAQFSTGVTAGAGYLWQRQEGPGNFIGLDAAQPLVMVGAYGQFAQKGIRGFIAGLQLRYQSQRQVQRFTAMNPNNPFELTEAQYNRYSYLVATPYVGVRPFGKLEIAAGPEISRLIQSRMTSLPRNPTGWIVGYTIKATYWFGRLGLEGGYSNQNTAYDSQGPFKFYNRYVYGVVKYSLTQ